MTVLLLAVFAAVCQGGVLRVIGGASATLGQLPYQVAVQITVGSSGFLCGGSIIAPNYILTAGHCVRDLSAGGANQDPANIRVVPGIDRQSTSGQRSVVRFHVHPSYSTSSGQSQRIDLAILELTTALTLSSNVAVVLLCQSGECGLAGSPLIVSGYGETQSDVGSSVSQFLKFADLTTVLQSSCSSKWDTNFGCSNCLPATNVCAQSSPTTVVPNKDSCFGDSGGPLVQPIAGVKKLWGVVSSGTVPADQSPSCGKQGEYGVYVSVPPNQQWITDVMNRRFDNTTAIDSACVATQTCTNTPPSANRPPFIIFPPFNWQWYYILAIVIGGLLAVALVVVICMCCCKK